MTIPHYDSDVDPHAQEELNRLAEIVDTIEALEDRIPTLVTILRQRNISWLLIGEQLGITAQGAQQRYGR